MTTGRLPFGKLWIAMERERRRAYSALVEARVLDAVDPGWRERVREHAEREYRAWLREAIRAGASGPESMPIVSTAPGSAR